MTARRSVPLVCGAALIAACATDRVPSAGQGANPAIDAAVADRVEQGRDKGYPKLSDVPARGATPAEAKALGDDAGRLRAEAETLRALRLEAGAERPASPLPRRAERLRAAVARDRAELRAQPPIKAPAEAPVSSEEPAR